MTRSRFLGRIKKKGVLSMKKLFNISLVVLVLTVIANIVFLCQPVYNGEYLPKNPEQGSPKRITFNDNVATISNYKIGAVSINDPKHIGNKVVIYYRDISTPTIIREMVFLRISVFTLKYDDWRSDSDGMKYSCQEAINCQIALSVVTVLSFAVCIITAKKSFFIKAKEN